MNICATLKINPTRRKKGRKRSNILAKIFQDTLIRRVIQQEIWSFRDFYSQKKTVEKETFEKRIVFKQGTLITQGLNKRFSFISWLLHLSSAIRFSLSNFILYLSLRILSSHSLLHSINTIYIQYILSIVLSPLL